MEQGFGPALSVSLTEEQEKDLEEMAKRFERTLGGDESGE